jgi:hypothetical protein
VTVARGHGGRGAIGHGGGSSWEESNESSRSGWSSEGATRSGSWLNERRGGPAAARCSGQRALG